MALAVGIGLIAVSSAAANGPCGQDFDADHACPTTSPVTDNGSLVTDNEADFYVFYAQKGTELHATATDTENPGCSGQDSLTSCGDVEADLYDSQGNALDEGTGESLPENGTAVPRTFATTLKAAGTYYLVVSGNLGFDANDNPTPVPYTLAVKASPNVQGPASTAPTTTSPSAPPPTPAPTDGWQGALDLGGAPLGPRPAAGVDSAGEQFVFWRGPDGSLRDKWYVGQRWHGPVRIGSAGKMASAPAVAVGPSGEQDVFWKGRNGALWETSHTRGWRRAVDLGGAPLGSGPAAGVDSAGEQFVFWRGTDGSLWDNSYVGQRWEGPLRIGSAGMMDSAPGVAVSRSGGQDVFWKGADGTLWEMQHG